jgi:hypothetical protein
MAKRTTLEADQHFLKHFKNREIIREDGVAIGVFPAAFLLRPADGQFPLEKWLSGQYYEFFDGSHQERLCACCHFIQIEMKKKDALCRLNIGDIKNAGQKRSKTLRVLHQPDEGEPAYAGLHGLPKSGEMQDDELLALLAELAFIEIHEIVDIL